MTRRPRALRLWTTLTLLILVVAAAILSACGGTNSTEPFLPTATGRGAAASPEIRVVVSVPVFVSMVRAVGGDLVDVTSIVPPGGDPATYQPTPDDIQQVADANLVFVNGSGLEPWLHDLIQEAGGTRIPVYQLALNMRAIPGGLPFERDGGLSVGRAPVNPYLWLDPVNAIEYVRRIALRLGQRDVSHAALYQSNAEAYVAKIEQLDDWATTQIEAIPLGQRRLVTYEDTMPYFADHYGIEIAGIVLNHPSDEPLPWQIPTLVQEIEETGVSTLFTGPDVNPELAGRLAVGARIKTVILDSAAPPADVGYLDMMRLDVERIVGALSGRARQNQW